MSDTKKHVYRSCIAVAALALAACGAVKKDEAGVVEARAQQRWNYLIEHHAEKAYDYLTPGFRQTITREKYALEKNDPAVRWTGARVGSHTCDGDTCKVRVWVDTMVRMPGIGKAQKASLPTDERWIRIGGNWYYLPDTRIKALPLKPETPGQGKSDGPAKSPE